MWRRKFGITILTLRARNSIQISSCFGDPGEDLQDPREDLQDPREDLQDSPGPNFHSNFLVFVPKSLFLSRFLLLFISSLPQKR